TMLARAERRIDPRVMTGAFVRLIDHDQLLFVLLDALVDKFCTHPEKRRIELPRALRRWAPDPRAFAGHIVEAKLVAATRVVLAWVERATGDDHASAIAAELDRMRAPSRGARRWESILMSSMGRAPFGPIARVGLRTLASSPSRAALS